MWLELALLRLTGPAGFFSSFGNESHLVHLLPYMYKAKWFHCSRLCVIMRYLGGNGTLV